MTDKKFKSAMEKVLKDIEGSSPEELFEELMSFKGEAAIAESMDALGLKTKDNTSSTRTGVSVGSSQGSALPLNKRLRESGRNT